MPSLDALLEAGGVVAGSAGSAHGEVTLPCTLVGHLLAES